MRYRKKYFVFETVNDRNTQQTTATQSKAVADDNDAYLFVSEYTHDSRHKVLVVGVIHHFNLFSSNTQQGDQVWSTLPWLICLLAALDKQTLANAATHPPARQLVRKC
jgi:hypothetical protein